MDDFLKTAFERLRHFCDEGLDSAPIAVLMIAIDKNGNEVSQVITDGSEGAESLARRAAGTATQDFTDAMNDDEVSDEALQRTLQ
jgi:hypothetical protein